MKVLVGCDMSDPAEKALGVGLDYARKLNATLIVVASLIGGTQEDVEEIHAVEKGLRLAEKQAIDGGVQCEKHLLMRGNAPGEDLVSFAGESGADLIVIGVKKRSKVGKLMFGSTAQYVILDAEAPVLAVK